MLSYRFDVAVVVIVIVVVVEGDRMPHFGCVVAAQWEMAINEPFSESLSVFWPTVSFDCTSDEL